MSEDRVRQGFEWLGEQGLDLQAVFDTAALPPAVAEPLVGSGVECRDYRRLVVLGNGGPRLWRRLVERHFEDPDPVDTYSRCAVSRFATDWLGCPPWRLLYPGDLPVALQPLGALAGWAHPSPLGMSIHPRYGLWFAYRAAFLVDLPLSPTAPHRGARPCDTCATRPCVAACPAGAVSAARDFALSRCVSHRIEPESSCAATCLSRLACPVGAEHRYDEDQLAHHQLRALDAMVRWRRRGVI